ncbi:isopropylmalate isomerase [Rhodobacter sp. SY28-1]|uniref:isopropylmalate isomerase n=1 Tax=Rhodobacter sp. SY28-1 TaxID=2562317 RepID=UPI0010C02D77|nr:isopropylmalate isomerase [Rhodobacter sp. SY28-1]
MRTALTCAFTQWRPELGDNHLMGWVTVGVYLGAAVASGLVARRLASADPANRSERWFWRMASVILLLLALNKQLDLQSLLTLFARCHAQLSGWYGARRGVQEAFIYLVAAGAVVTIGLMTLLLRGILSRIWLALVGLGFVCAFVVIRAASFHHVDVLLGSSSAGIKLNWLLELPGPILVALVAWRRVSGGSTR